MARSGEVFVFSHPSLDTLSPFLSFLPGSETAFSDNDESTTLFVFFFSV
ncbi:hypothetical protein CCACVL1_09145 [Corchorus capsularis]|uniref:Uncharacterized protein n=1 Tax=Corchorus capsularis TaxID=210143 RepID=A0A1R3IXM1_COCAP|nr:hypothetical protein CCACVL1_09145 [Corchorus capsularis]